MNRNKQVEQAQIQAFVAEAGGRHYQRGPKNKPPDGVFSFRGKKIAVEHTRLLREKPMESEAVLERAVRSAGQSFVDPYPGRLRVSASVNVALPPGNKHIRVTTRDRESIIRDLQSVVKRRAPRVDRHVVVEGWREKLHGFPFPKGIDTVDIDRRQSRKESYWVTSGGLAVPQLRPETKEFSNALTKKEARLPDYQVGYDECWLLLVVETGTLSGYWDYDYFPFSHVFKTAFDHLILFDAFGSKVMSLRCW